MRKYVLRLRAKRLLERLKYFQKDDFPATGPMIIAIKHLPQITSRCTLVRITIGTSTDQDVIFNPGDVPLFILSQLEVQKLTTKSSPEVFPCVAGFVLESLCHAFSQLWEGISNPVPLALFPAASDLLRLRLSQDQDGPSGLHYP